MRELRLTSALAMFKMEIEADQWKHYADGLALNGCVLESPAIHYELMNKVAVSA